MAFKKREGSKAKQAIKWHHQDFKSDLFQAQWLLILFHRSCVVKAPCCSRRPAIASLWLAKTANQLAKYPQKPEWQDKSRGSCSLSATCGYTLPKELTLIASFGWSFLATTSAAVRLEQDNPKPQMTLSKFKLAKESVLFPQGSWLGRQATCIYTMAVF